MCAWRHLHLLSLRMVLAVSSSPENYLWHGRAWTVLRQNAHKFLFLVGLFRSVLCGMGLRIGNQFVGSFTVFGLL